MFFSSFINLDFCLNWLAHTFKKVSEPKGLMRKSYLTKYNINNCDLSLDPTSNVFIYVHSLDVKVGVKIH
jgi:hypothetical protein